MSQMKKAKKAKEDGKMRAAAKPARVAPARKAGATSAKAARPAKTPAANAETRTETISAPAGIADRAALLAERRERILERAGVRARREASLQPREDGDARFYDPDDYGGGPPGENVESEVGWLPLDGRPR